MVGGKDLPLVKSDLKVVSSFALLIFLIVFAIEAQPREIPEGFFDGEQPENGEVPNGNITIMEDIEVLSSSGYTSEGQTTEEPFLLDQTLVVSISLQLTWSDDYGSNDEFRVTLLQDGTDIGSESGTSGSLSIDVENNAGLLVGNFTVEIEAVDCPGVVGPNPIDLDNGNNWDLKVDARVSMGDV